MKVFLKSVLVYAMGVAINLLIIKNYYKINFAYDIDGKSFLKAESMLSFFATPTVMFVCYDSNSKWCN